jgi:endonuclease IV
LREKDAKRVSFVSVIFSAIKEIELLDRRKTKMAAAMIGGHIRFSKTAVEQAAACSFPAQVFLMSPKAYYREGTRDALLASIEHFPKHFIVHSAYPVYPWSKTESVREKSYADISASIKVLSEKIRDPDVHKYYLVHAAKARISNSLPEETAAVRKCIADAFPADLPRDVTVLFETPATRFYTSPRALSALLVSNRFKLCIDTAHIWGGGYNISSAAGAAEYFSHFQIGDIGLFHLNDSLSPLGSQKDIHAPCGDGVIWGSDRSGLNWIVEYATRNNIPMILERSYGLPAEYQPEIEKILQT